MTLWRDHLTTQILPWWESRAVDAEHAGVLTCFDNAGALLSTDKYSWSQGRWAWLAAELAFEMDAGRLPGDADRWRDRAVTTARFLSEHVILPTHRTVFRTDREGRALPDQEGDVATSVFADLFVVLGLGAGARAVTEQAEADRWYASATAILIEAERSIGARTARSEPYPVPAGFGSLAWPMNLLHASAELLRHRNDDAVRGVRDRSWANLVGSDGMLASSSWWEFRPDEYALGDTLLARHRTPGHLLELLWMLVHATNPVAGSASVPPPEPAVDTAQLAVLAQRACEIGWDDECGGLLRYSNRDGGRPKGSLLGADPGRYEQLVATTWDTKLWWVHAEAIYTLTMLADHVPELQSWAERIATYTMTTFPDPGGEWLQIRGRDGSPLDAVVALPVKDPFHIARSLLLLHRHDHQLSTQKES